MITYSPRMCVSRTLISRLGPGRLASRRRVTTSPSQKAAAKEPRPNSACKDSFTPFPAAATVHPVEKSMADEEPSAYMPRSGTKHETTVAADGSGDYKTVQEGIDSLSENGGTVLIKPGTYREVVHVAKPHVRLQGLADSPEKVVIVYSNSADSSGGTFHSATAFVTGDDFYADNLTFQNDYSRNHGLQPQGSQAIALSVRGDPRCFRNVRFLGAQDTLFAASRSCGRRRPLHTLTAVFLQLLYRRQCRFHLWRRGGSLRSLPYPCHRARTAVSMLRPRASGIRSSKAAMSSIIAELPPMPRLESCSSVVPGVRLQRWFF